jgi:hypothetical protein
MAKVAIGGPNQLFERSWTGMVPPTAARNQRTEPPGGRSMALLRRLPLLLAGPNL